MAKLQQTVQSMVEMLQRTGREESERGVYRITRKSFEDQHTSNLYHYGTPTARVTNGVPFYLYGESISDASSVETFINEVMYTNMNIQFGFRPVNGGFYCYVYDRETDTGEYVFQDEFEDGYDFADKVCEVVGV